MTKSSLLLALLLWAAALTGLAGDKLGLRLVEATNDNSGVAPQLADVADLLKRNMPFTGYRLLDTKTLALPAKGAVEMKLGFSVRCTGEQNNLAVTVVQKRDVLLRTTAALEDGKPLILGGFPTTDGRIILILLVR